MGYHWFDYWRGMASPSLVAERVTREIHHPMTFAPKGFTVSYGARRSPGDSRLRDRRGVDNRIRDRRDGPRFQSSGVAGTAHGAQYDVYADQVVEDLFGTTAGNLTASEEAFLSKLEQIGNDIARGAGELRKGYAIPPGLHAALDELGADDQLDRIGRIGLKNLERVTRTLRIGREDDD